MSSQNRTERRLRPVVWVGNVLAIVLFIALWALADSVGVPGTIFRVPTGLVATVGIALNAASATVGIWSVKPAFSLCLFSYLAGAVFATGLFQKKAGTAQIEIAAASPAKVSRVWVTEFDWLEPSTRPDDYFGYKGQPNINARELHRDFDVTYHHNAEGFRLQPPPPANPKGRIVIIGCSNTYGVGVEDHQTYASILQKEAWPDYTVESRAVSGWGTTHANLMVRKLLEEPQDCTLILYAFITHHVGRNHLRKTWYHHEQFPYFTLESGQLEYHGLRSRDEPRLDASPKLDKVERELTLALMRDMAQRCDARDVPFAVLVIDCNTPQPEFMESLRASNEVANLDISGICQQVYPINGHPTPACHRWFAYAIAAHPGIAEIANRPDLFRPDSVRVDGLNRQAGQFLLRLPNGTVSLKNPSSPSDSWRMSELTVPIPEPYGALFAIRPFQLVSEKEYSLVFDVKADAERGFAVTASQTFPPMEGLGMYQDCKATTEWERVEISFSPSRTEDYASVSFFLGGPDSMIPIEFRNVSLTCEGEPVAPGPLAPIAEPPHQLVGSLMQLP